MSKSWGKLFLNFVCFTESLNFKPKKVKKLALKSQLLTVQILTKMFRCSFCVFLILLLLYQHNFPNKNTRRPKSRNWRNKICISNKRESAKGLKSSNINYFNQLWIKKMHQMQMQKQYEIMMISYCFCHIHCFSSLKALETKIKSLIPHSSGKKWIIQFQVNGNKISRV